LNYEKAMFAAVRSLVYQFVSTPERLINDMFRNERTKNSSPKKVVIK
jgi:hypothetical protein